MRNRSIPLLLTSLLFCAAALRAQDGTGDADLARVQQFVRLASSAMAEFHSAGGEDGDPDHPGGEWGDRLWRLSVEYAGSEAGGLAAAEALHFLMHAGRMEELEARVEALSPEDPAWDRLLEVLAEGARKSGDPSFFESQAERLLAAWTDAERRADLQLLLAEEALERGEEVTARRRFEQARLASPESTAAAAAGGALYELEALQPGRLAPDFEAVARDGSEVALSTLRGHPVLIIFWATW